MRFLLLSLLLSVVLLSGAAYAQDSWALVDQDIPSALTWDEVAATSVTANNDSGTAWDTTYSLNSVQGITPLATAINRWGITGVDVVGSVATGLDYTFDFNILAPPISTLKYNLPLTPTSVGVVEAFDNNWMMANAGALIQTDVAVQGTTISRFPDLPADDPGTPANEAWANFQVEELGGLIPFVVGGYADGTYRPAVNVTRGNMAVFMKRALQLGDAVYVDGTFTDVTTAYPAANDIQACVDAGIVQGYNDNTYRPTNPVNRGSMAIYIARGLAGGDTLVPSGPATPSFSDVGTSAQQYKYVEYAVAQGVVQGYANGTYRPTLNVTRASMAVFVYRAFVQPSGCAVVLAGPSLTAVDTDTAGYDGWSPTNAATNEADPGVTAYIGFDGARFKSDQTDFTVTFELVADDDSIEAEDTQTVDASAGLAAVEATGVPYVYAKWVLPAVAAGHYRLVTSINDTQLTRESEIWIGAPASPVTVFGRDGDADLLALTDDPGTPEADGGCTGERTPVAGSLETSMAASDDVYYQTERTTFPEDTNWTGYCDWNEASAIAFDIPAGATSLDLTFEYRVNTLTDWGLDNNCCDQWGAGLNGNIENCCDSWGVLDPAWALGLGMPVVHTPEYTADLGVSISGWGLRVMSGPGSGGNWQTQWWDNTAYDLVPDPDDNDDFWVLDGSGDKNLPAENDVQGGGPMYTHIGFTGHPFVDTTFQWGIQDARAYITDDNKVIVTLCGGSWQTTSVDLASLTVGFGAPPLF